MNTFRLLVAGSRYWPRGDVLPDALCAAAVMARENHGEVVLVHGHCPTGGDAQADYLWTSWGWRVERHPADWDSCGAGCPPGNHRVRRAPDDVHHPGLLDTYCPVAGPRRNRHMVGLGAGGMLGFVTGPQWSGTRGCMRLAERAGIPFREYRPSGLFVDRWPKPGLLQPGLW